MEINIGLAADRPLNWQDSIYDMGSCLIFYNFKAKMLQKAMDYLKDLIIC